MKDYLVISDYCENSFKSHGDNYRGVAWTREFDAKMHKKIMLDSIRVEDKPITLLDLGCGLSHLYEYIKSNKIPDIHYTGLDISKVFIAESKKKFPENDYILMDILEDDSTLGMYDYIFINGIFTAKESLSFDAMLAFFKRMISTAFRHAKKAVVFNTTSKQVDWERDDLFHLPLDVLANFLHKEISNQFIIRHDCGIYQQTVAVYRERCKLDDNDNTRNSPFA